MLLTAIDQREVLRGDFFPAHWPEEDAGLDIEQITCTMVQAKSRFGRICMIGQHDIGPENYDNTETEELKVASPKFEPPQTGISVTEAGKLANLLVKCLRYHSKSRLTANDVVEAEWFQHADTIEGSIDGK